MTKNHIPFNRPCFAGSEQRYIAQAITNMHISGDGEFTRKCHRFLQDNLGVVQALLTTSCTHALEMTALLLDIEPGDEVIVPSFTFVSTINAFILRGARPIFIDSRPDTLNLDETQLEQYITPRTKVIVVMHYAGVGCEMEKILAIATKHNIHVVEDNAHGLFGKYKGQYLGTFGTFATQSFHETKNFTCGEGGALLINNPHYQERAETLREKGTNRSRFFRGQIDKYTWIDVGSSYLPSDLLAAFLYAQFETKDVIQTARQQIWERYASCLESWAMTNGVRLPIVPANCEQSYHMFYLLMPSLTRRQALIDYLKAEDIHSVFHYLPLHLSPMGRRFGGKLGDCPIAEDISDRLIRLPFYNDLTEPDQIRVIEMVQSFPARG